LPLVLLGAVLLAGSCTRKGAVDAYGILDAKSWMIAVSEPGQIAALDVREGAVLEKDAVVGCLDTTRLQLQLKALESQIQALRPTLPDTGRQLDVLYRQRESLQRERERVAALVGSGSAATRQLDDIDDKLRVLDSQIGAARSNLSRETASVLATIESLKSQADIVRDQIASCVIRNPERGTVTAQYAHLHEFVAAGHPIYKLSDYDHLYVDTWVDGATLARIALGDGALVRTDGADGKPAEVRGQVSYIAEEAEFTPNKILTRETRTKLVYHVRIDLPYEGKMKPGMPAEILFDAAR
jgi:HlyD family secretion protein